MEQHVKNYVKQINAYRYCDSGGIIAQTTKISGCKNQYEMFKHDNIETILLKINKYVSDILPSAKDVMIYQNIIEISESAVEILELKTKISDTKTEILKLKTEILKISDSHIKNNEATLVIPKTENNVNFEKTKIKRNKPITHMTNEMKSVCPECGKKFSTKYSCERHLLGCGDNCINNRTTCIHCGKKLCDRFSRAYHENKCNGIVKTDTKICSFCSKDFANKYVRRLHEKTVHKKVQ